eukprot:gene27495-30401_t
MARLGYLELPVGDTATAKAFYSAVFGWQFSDFGPTYAATATGDTEIGLQADPAEATAAPLAVIEVADLEATEAAVRAAGGEITRAVFAFPGGHRFHFRDNTGHELAAATYDTERAPVSSRAVAIGIVGVAVPVLIGWGIGQTHLGLGIGLGAMLLGGGTREADGVVEALGLSLAAVGAALLLVAVPWGDAAMIALAGAVGLAGGYSRPLAVASVRFCIYLVLCVSVLDGAPDRRLAAAAFAIGALWNIALRQLIGGP